MHSATFLCAQSRRRERFRNFRHSLDDEVQGASGFLSPDIVATVAHGLWSSRFEERSEDGTTSSAARAKKITRRNKRWQNAGNTQCMQRVGTNVLMRNCSGAGAQKWNETRLTITAGEFTFRFYRYSGQGRCMKRSGTRLITKACGGDVDFGFRIAQVGNRTTIQQGVHFVTTTPARNKRVAFQRRPGNLPKNTVIRDRWNFRN